MCIFTNINNSKNIVWIWFNRRLVESLDIHFEPHLQKVHICMLSRRFVSKRTSSFKNHIPHYASNCLGLWMWFIYRVIIQQNTQKITFAMLCNKSLDSDKFQTTATCKLSLFLLEHSAILLIFRWMVKVKTYSKRRN